MIPLSLFGSTVECQLCSDCATVQHEENERELPVRKSVFDVVQCGVKENSCIVPSSRFDTNSFMDEIRSSQLLVREHNS